MNANQARALSDAELNAGVGQTGLVRQSGQSWSAEKRYDSETHSANTIRALVDRGYLVLYVRGTVAHITDSGIEALQDFRSCQ